MDQVWHRVHAATASVGLMRTLSNPNARFADDHGEPDPIAREAIARVSDQISYIRALVALCSSRLLMPIVAAGDDSGGEKQAEMAAVKLVNDQGTFLLAFTGLDSMEAWQKGARPVPCTLDDLCVTVREAGADQLLIDAAGPTSLVISGEPLQRFAQGFALVEFEGEAFGWVKKSDADQIANLEGALSSLEAMIAEVEAEAAAAQEAERESSVEETAGETQAVGEDTKV